MYLYDTDTKTWISASETCVGTDRLLQVQNGELTVHICHLTQFAVFGSQGKLFFVLKINFVMKLEEMEFCLLQVLSLF